MRKLRKVEFEDLAVITRAMNMLMEARADIRKVHAMRAARAITIALKSLDGARRHTQRCLREQREPEGT